MTKTELADSVADLQRSDGPFTRQQISLGGALGDPVCLGTGLSPRIFQYRTQIRNEHVEAVTALPLVVLDLHSTRIDDQIARHLQAFSRLRKLDLSGTELSDAGFGALVPLPELRELFIGNGEAGDQALTAAAAQSKLTVLDASASQISDAGVQGLRDVLLQELVVSDSNIGDDALLRICRTLTSLWIGSTEVTDEGAAHLSALDGLEHLDVSHNEQLTDGFLLPLRGLPLKSLNLWKTSVSSAGLPHLPATLQRLVLRGTRVADGGFASLARLGALRELDLRDLPITDVSLEVVAGLFGLRTVALSKTQVTGRGLPCVSELEDLETLSLDFVDVRDADLEHLRVLPRLQHLSLIGTKVSNEGVERLLTFPALRSVDVYATKATRDCRWDAVSVKIGVK